MLLFTRAQLMPCGIMHLLDILILKERPISQKLYVIGVILYKVKITVHGRETIEEQQSTMEEDLSYLSSFGLWLTEWKDSGGGGLSKQTFECAICSCNDILALLPYLFERYPEQVTIYLQFYILDSRIALKSYIRIT